jgi:CDP-4-dehydro-6-deoxyglucose reductase
MDRYVDIWRAARLAGVSRTEIQERIAGGELESFEGRVDVNSLARLYPAALKGDGLLIDFVEQVKEDALRKGVRARERRQDPDALAADLIAARRELEHFKRQNARQRAVLDDVERMLQDLQARVRPAHLVKNVLLWLRSKREEND